MSALLALAKAAAGFLAPCAVLAGLVAVSPYLQPEVAGVVWIISLIGLIAAGGFIIAVFEQKEVAAGCLAFAVVVLVSGCGLMCLGGWRGF